MFYFVFSFSFNFYIKTNWTSNDSLLKRLSQEKNLKDSSPTGTRSSNYGFLETQRTRPCENDNNNNNNNKNDRQRLGSVRACVASVPISARQKNSSNRLKKPTETIATQAKALPSFWCRQSICELSRVLLIPLFQLFLSGRKDCC